MELTEFLAARLREDEDLAQAAMANRYIAPPTEATLYVLPPDTPLERHKMHHDPARVLAQVEALRSIVDEHGARTTDYLDAPPEQSCRRCGKPDEYPVPFPCRTQRHLAAIWQSHPDYNPAWGG